MSDQIYVIGYARVSSPKQAQQGEGLDDQERIIKRYCDKMGWTLFPKDTVFQENYTGTKKDRPIYNQILAMLKENKKAINIKYLVFWDFDRLTRAGSVDYDQIWKDVESFDVELRDTTGIIQDKKDAFEEFGLRKVYDFAVGRPSKDAEQEKVETAKKERIKILQRLIKPQIRLTQEGYHIGRPDYGFQNEKIFVENKKKCIQVRYEPEARFVEAIYKMRIENTLSDTEICNAVNSMGYKSRVMNKWSKDRKTVISKIGGNPLTEKQLQVIIKRSTYCGVICEEWTNHLPIKAKYKGLISVDDWNKANRGKLYLDLLPDGSVELLKNIGVHGKKRHKYNPKFPFKGVLMCDVCKSMGKSKPLKASASKGKSGKYFPAYHCERGHKRSSFTQKEVESKVNTFFENIKFTDNFLEIFGKTIHLQFRKREGELAEYTAKANTNVADLEIQKSILIKSFPTATLPEVRTSIEEEIVKLQKQIDTAKNNRDAMEIDEADVTNFIQWCKEIMEHPAKLLADISSEQELIHISSLFFEELPTYGEIVSGTPKLALVFKLSEQYKVDKSALVTLPGIEPGFQA